MGTRSGDIDPAIMEFIAKKENLDIDGVMNVLNKKSGVEGLSGVSSDFRDLEAAYNEGNPRAIDACEVFAYRVAKYIGAYVAAMNGVDAIAFTAGIGENTSFIREKIVSYLGYLGIKLEKILNCYGITWGELSELNVSQINAIETDYYNRYGENISIMFNFKQLHNV